ncbi:MAG: RNA polymerase sigma-70 factor [Bacteroides sp.]|nr:RNA polymerase sigma-70 factor [Bacteroides sp.]
MTEQEVRRYLRQMKDEDSQQAFRAFYDLTYDRLFRIAYYYVGCEKWAQEVVIDVFVRLWEMRARLPQLNSIEDYCFILTKNASLNYLEKENRRATLSSDCLPEPSEQADSPEDTLIGEELFAHYVKALDRLPERCRDIFIRIREEKQTYAQVAEALNISTKTVDAQLQKATKRLKDMLQPYIDKDER